MIRSKYLNVNTVKMLILDEADDLLSEGFAEQIHDIFSHLPKNIQVGLFSATMPNEVLLLTNKFMREPIRFLKERDELSLKGISQYQVLIPFDETSPDEVKLSIVDDIYHKIIIAQAVIFCNTRKKVEFLSQQLKSKDFSIITMHSDMPDQEKRRVMKAFRDGDSRILVATDVMARGIDIQHVSIVINFDIPQNKENFIHRSGRAGRYGRKGVTINLVNEKEVELVKDIEEYYSICIDSLPQDFDKNLST
jgi:translation initiation factor 4A